MMMNPIPEKATQRFRDAGKAWDVPVVLPFWTGPSGIMKTNWCIVEPVAYRCPRRGEYYLSGAIPEVYKVYNDLSTPYLVVKPGKKVVAKKFWVIEEEDEAK